MASPNITLTGNFESITGAGTGSATITLTGYGTSVPRVSGTGIVAVAKYTVSLSASFSITIWGNDQLTPNGTSYTIAFFDSKGAFVASNTYTFTGGPKTVDISTL